MYLIYFIYEDAISIWNVNTVEDANTVESTET